MSSRVCLIFIVSTLVSCLLASSSAHSNSNDKGEINIYTSFTKQQYLEDIEQLAETIVANHPRPFKFIKKKDFWAMVEQKKKSISDKTQYGDFIWQMSELLASIGCGHSSFRYYFNQEIEALPLETRFPLEVKIFADKLYVTDPLSNLDKVKKGAEIVSINGTRVEQIMPSIYKHIFADANLVGNKRANFNVQANSYLAYYFNFSDSYEVVLKGDEQGVTLLPIKKYQPKPLIAANDPCQESLCLNFIEQNSAKLTVRSFDYYGNRSAIFDKFIESSFAEIKASKVENLIIDIRGNGGGNAFSAAYLLAHIASKSYTFYASDSPGAERLKQPIEPYSNSFQGNTFIIVDGSDGSSTGYFIALAKHNKFAQLVGSDSGSSFSTNGGYKDHQLTNTGILYRVSTDIFKTSANSFIYGKPIAPDHKVIQTIDDALIGRDTILNFTLDLIVKQEQVKEELVAN